MCIEEVNNSKQVEIEKISAIEEMFTPNEI
jgi:hypothetical protein